MPVALCEWSTPERRRLDQALPTIPSDIYLSIIELIASSARSLAPEQFKILSNLSGTCRLFANICLPRIYEVVQFCLPDYCYHFYAINYEALLGSILFTQISEKQPLTLALAQSVRGCRLLFPCARDDLYAERCIAVMSHMKNIRKLEFLNCQVDGEYWSMFAEMASLEDLEFDTCNFVQDLVPAEPEKSLKLKVSRLVVLDCVTEHRQTITQAINRFDTGALRTLVANFWAIKEQDWLRQSAITDLHIYAFEDAFKASDPSHTLELTVNVVLVKAPHSLRVLRFTVARELLAP